MGRRKTQQEWDTEVLGTVGDEYSFLEEYINSSTKIKVQHKNCGHVYHVKPNSFLNGKRCPECAIKNRKVPPNKRLSNKEWVRKVESMVGDEYIFLEDYKGSSKKISVLHQECGSKYFIAPQYFTRGSRCPKCSHKNGTTKHRKTQEEFDLEIYDMCGEEYTFIEAYVNTYTPILVRHNNCGNEYRTAPRDFIKGRRCRKCFFESTLKTQSQWESEVYDLVKDEYTFTEYYINDSTKITVRHNVCGKTYQVKPNNFLNGTRCIYCPSSRGERLVAEYLDYLDVPYIPQWEFDDLRYINRLSFDFYLPDHNTLIEYQGAQHYTPIDFFGGVDALQEQKVRDNLKMEYASAHGYHLIEVPYTEDTGDKVKEFIELRLLNNYVV